MLVGFDPASGHEQQGAGRPALVLSVQAFNQLGMTLVAPITQGGNFARYAGFSVPLHCEEGDVHGVVLVNQVRMMDLRARLAKGSVWLRVSLAKPYRGFSCRWWWKKGFILLVVKLNAPSPAFRVSPEELIYSLRARRRQRFQL